MMSSITAGPSERYKRPSRKPSITNGNVCATFGTELAQTTSFAERLALDDVREDEQRRHRDDAGNAAATAASSASGMRTGSRIGQARA